MSSSNEKLTDHQYNGQGSPGKTSTEDLPYAPEEVDYNDEKEAMDEEYGHAAEKRKRFYQTKRFWIRCALITVVILAIFIPLLLIVILPKLVQSIVNHSTMSMSQLNMTDATETDVKVSLTGGIANAGIFPATIDFPEPILVQWEGKTLGSMRMSSVSASGGKASIVDSTTFTIVDKEAFSTFAKAMVCYFPLSSASLLKSLGCISLSISVACCVILAAKRTCLIYSNTRLSSVPSLPIISIV